MSKKKKKGRKVSLSLKEKKSWVGMLLSSSTEGNFIDLTNGSFDNIYFIQYIGDIIVVIKEHTFVLTKGTFKGAANYNEYLQ